MNASCLGTSTAHRAQTYADQGATRGSPIPQTPACSHRSGRSIRRQYTARALLLLQPQVEKTAERVSHPAVLACDVAGTVSRLVVTLSTIKLLLLLLAPVCAPASAPQQSEGKHRNAAAHRDAPRVQQSQGLRRTLWSQRTDLKPGA